MVLKKGIAKAVDTAVKSIVDNSKAVAGSEDIARVGTVSSADEAVGKLIAEAMENDGCCSSTHSFFMYFTILVVYPVHSLLYL